MLSRAFGADMSLVCPTNVKTLPEALVERSTTGCCNELKRPRGTMTSCLPGVHDETPHKCRRVCMDKVTKAADPSSKQEEVTPGVSLSYPSDDESGSASDTSSGALHCCMGGDGTAHVWQVAPSSTSMLLAGSTRLSVPSAPGGEDACSDASSSDGAMAGLLHNMVDAARLSAECMSAARCALPAPPAAVPAASSCSSDQSSYSSLPPPLQVPQGQLGAQPKLHVWQRSLQPLRSILRCPAGAAGRCDGPFAGECSMEEYASGSAAEQDVLQEDCIAPHLLHAGQEVALEAVACSGLEGSRWAGGDDGAVGSVCLGVGMFAVHSMAAECSSPGCACSAPWAAGCASGLQASACQPVLKHVQFARVVRVRYVPNVALQRRQRELLLSAEAASEQRQAVLGTLPHRPSPPALQPCVWLSTPEAAWRTSGLAGWEQLPGGSVRMSEEVVMPHASCSLQATRPTPRWRPSGLHLSERPSGEFAVQQDDVDREEEHCCCGGVCCVQRDLEAAAAAGLPLSQAPAASHLPVSPLCGVPLMHGGKQLPRCRARDTPCAWAAAGCVDAPRSAASCVGPGDDCGGCGWVPGVAAGAGAAGAAGLLPGRCAGALEGAGTREVPVEGDEADVDMSACPPKLRIKIPRRYAELWARHVADAAPHAPVHAVPHAAAAAGVLEGVRRHAPASSPRGAAAAAPAAGLPAPQLLRVTIRVE